MSENNTNTELLTPAKIAELLKKSLAKVKKAILELSLTPDLIKGKCNYFGLENIEKINKFII